jgi:hypothetical protein
MRLPGGLDQPLSEQAKIESPTATTPSILNRRDIGFSQALVTVAV